MLAGDGKRESRELPRQVRPDTGNRDAGTADWSDVVQGARGHPGSELSGARLGEAVNQDRIESGESGSEGRDKLAQARGNDAVEHDRTASRVAQPRGQIQRRVTISKFEMLCAH